MKSIKNVKLGINPKDMVVNVIADVEMKDKDDADDLYLVMFNVMDSPLRLSLFTIGNLYELVKRNSNLSESEILNVMKNSPEKYIQYAVGNMDALGDYGVENVKIVLDSESNSKKARLVLSSMIDKKKYYQKSTYFVEGEEIKKEQEIDTEPLIPQLKMMMEITKRWENFNPADFQKDIENGIIKL
jgi:hypothetical protein